MKNAAEVFAKARTASSRLAAKNKELETANKAVQTAEKNLSDAENKLTELENKKSQAEALVTDLKEVQKPAAYNKWQEEAEKLSALEGKVTEEEDKLPALTEAQTAQETLLTRYETKLKEYKEALEKAKNEGVEVKKLFGLTERDKIQEFIDGTAPLWYKFDSDNLAIFISIKEKNDFTKILYDEISTKWANNILDETFEGEGVDIFRIYYEGPDREYTYMYNANGATTFRALRNRINNFPETFTGVEKTVKEVNQDAIDAAQELYDEQNAKVMAQRVAVQNAKDAVSAQNAVITAAKQAVTDQKGVIATAKAEYEAYDGTDEEPGLIAKAEAAVTAIETEIETAKTEKNDCQGALNKANAEVAKIEDDIAEINDDAEKVNDYKTLSITSNIAVTDAALTLGDWGSDYTINGNGYVITYPADAEGSLVGTNRGVINNLGVVHGTLSTANAGNIRIAFETSDGTNYDLYDASGTHTEAPMSGDLAYNRARPYFGVTINADGIFGTLDKKTAANTVYKAEWTDARTKNTTTFYTNATATDLSYNPAKGKANTFTYVLDNDLNVTAAFTAKNVVVKGICKNAELTDNVAEGDNGYIYIPTAFKAENLSYNRNFLSSTLATVCLPFEVSEATFKAAGVTKTMQFYEVEAATNTYWFKYQDGSMRANEPYILKFNEDFAGGAIFSALTDINVAATGNIDRFAVAPERPGSGADFLGVFVSTNATQLAQGGYTLYGFGGGKFRPMTISESNKCLPFRTYVRSRNTGNAPAEVFNLGELDEDGNVVSDGGETAISKTEAEAFSVKGINGALVITTDKAQRVSVYTLSGSLVKATTVEVGTVTVPVAAGMYIVNGKKVIVK